MPSVVLCQRAPVMSLEGIFRAASAFTVQPSLSTISEINYKVWSSFLCRTWIFGLSGDLRLAHYCTILNRNLMRLIIAGALCELKVRRVCNLESPSQIATYITQTYIFKFVVLFGCLILF